MKRYFESIYGPSYVAGDPRLLSLVVLYALVAAEVRRRLPLDPWNTLVVGVEHIEGCQYVAAQGARHDIPTFHPGDDVPDIGDVRKMCMLVVEPRRSAPRRLARHERQQGRGDGFGIRGCECVGRAAAYQRHRPAEVKPRGGVVDRFTRRR